MCVWTLRDSIAPASQQVTRLDLRLVFGSQSEMSSASCQFPWRNSRCIILARVSMFPTASPFPRIKSIINTSRWEVGSCAVLDTVWGGFPVGSRWVLVGSAWVPLALPCRFLLGSRWVPSGFALGSVWVPLALPCSVRWVRGGLRVGFAAVPCGLGFWSGLQGGVGCKLPPHPPKEKRRNNKKWERGAQEIACLGRPKACCAHSNTYMWVTPSCLQLFGRKYTPFLASLFHSAARRHGRQCARAGRGKPDIDVVVQL